MRTIDMKILFLSLIALSIITVISVTAQNCAGRVNKSNGGYVNRQNEEGVLATEIMVPLSAKLP